MIGTKVERNSSIILLGKFSHSAIELETLILIVMQHKAAYLVILCCALMHMTVIGSDVVLYHAVDKNGTLFFLVSQGVAYLMYPLLGWLADVCFTRYKFIKFSITIIVATILMIIAVSLFLKFPQVRAYYFLVGLSIIIGTRCWRTPQYLFPLVLLELYITWDNQSLHTPSLDYSSTGTLASAPSNWTYHIYAMYICFHMSSPS